MKNKPEYKLIVQLVTWNGEKYIPYLFESLRNQTSNNWFLSILDNASSKKTEELIYKELVNFPVKWSFVKSDENIGFCGGHNQLFQSNDSEYILLLNQDLYLLPDVFDKIVKYLDNNSNVSSVSPRLMKWNFNELSNNVSKNSSIEESFSSLVDSIGLKMFRNRRFVDQFASEQWKNICNLFSDNSYNVFGISGSCPVYRRSSVIEVDPDSRYLFDTTYGSYKEDVDLAYRLYNSGNKSVVLLDTVVYHDRSASTSKKLDDFSSALSKKNQKAHIKVQSYKNHLKTLYKNETILNFLLDFPWIIWYELKKFVWFLLFDRTVLKGLGDLWKERSYLTRQRRFLSKKNLISRKEFRNWIN